MRKRLIFSSKFLVLILALTGCAHTSQQIAQPHDDGPLQRGETSRVYVNRSMEMAGGAYSMKVFDGDKLIGKVAPGGGLFWDRSPGTASISASDFYGNRLGPIGLNALPGYSYHLTLAFSSGLQLAQEVAHVTQAPPSPAAPEIAETKKKFVGSGFSVSANGIIATAYHVVKDAKVITVKFPNGISVPARTIAVCEELDLALLQADQATQTYLWIDKSSELKLGEKVFTIGYPAPDLLGSDPKYSEGTVSGVRAFENDKAFIQISTPIQPGNSGGPLCNEQGHVIGVICSTAAVDYFRAHTGTLPQNVNWAVRAHFLLDMIKDFETLSSPAAPSPNQVTYVIKCVCLIVAEQ